MNRRQAVTPYELVTVLEAIEDLNRSVDTIGLLLFGQKYTDTLDNLNTIAGDTP